MTKPTRNTTPTVGKSRGSPLMPPCKTPPPLKPLPPQFDGDMTVLQVGGTAVNVARIVPGERRYLAVGGLILGVDPNARTVNAFPFVPRLRGDVFVFNANGAIPDSAFTRPRTVIPKTTWADVLQS